MRRSRLSAAGDDGLTSIKDQAHESRLFAGRAVIALVLVLIAFLVVIGRLFYLQVLSHDHYTTLSENNRVRIQPLPPTRGLIFDRNGVLLADNLPSYRLEITPAQVEGLDATLASLGKLVEIDEQDIARFRRLARRSSAFSGVPLRFRLDDTELARIAVNLHRLPGVDIRADLTRHYPLGAHAAHVIGYVGRIDEDELQRIDPSQYSGSSHIGKTGVERAYEDLLRGTVGYQQVETNAQGRVLRVLERTAPIPGRNVYLTVDSRLQAVAESALEGQTGAIVAIEPASGEILAMASMPVYDPNPFVNGIDAASYRALNASRDRPLFNRALRGTYPPGSTIKPFVGLAGLELGVVHRGKALYCPGHYSLPGSSHRFRDWKRWGHGRTNLEKAVVESCDVYFYDLALNLGIDRIHDFLGQFGLGQATGVDLVGEKSGLLPSKAWKRRVHDQPWYHGETLIAGIGQGYMLTTPLQLAHATAALARHGRHTRPRVLRAVQDPGSPERRLEPPRPLPPIVPADPGNWDHITQAMTEVVHGPRGTARRIGLDAPYRIAGKTGTAQVFSLGQDEKYDSDKLARHLQDHALFVAFAPAEAPAIAVAVIVEHGGGGGATAAPVARRVIDAHLLDSRP